jgi:hypothetical protein
MDGVHLGLARHPQNLVNRKIGLDRAFSLADLIGLVGLEAVEGKLVLLGIDGHGRDAQFRGGAENADGNF